MSELGYCCINLELRELKPSIYTGRTVIKRLFNINTVGSLCLNNVKDCLSTLQWNEKHNIKCFRFTSNLFPMVTEQSCAYSILDLKESSEIIDGLHKIGQYAYNNNHILSIHPGPYTVLCSDNPKVVENSIRDLEMHNWICDKICEKIPKDFKININFHIGKSFDVNTGKAFILNYNKLSDSAKLRVCIENDDKLKGWSISKLYNNIYLETGIPLTLDIHHSQFSRENELSIEDEFNLAKSTWNDCWQETHYSESRDESKERPAHSDYYKYKIPEFITNEHKVYIHLESKMKERSLLKYRNDFE